MHPKMLKAMRAKKKRAVDPNAPPRPNLLSHDKKIKEMGAQHEHDLAQIKQAVSALERKVRHQSAYIDALHATVAKQLLKK